LAARAPSNAQAFLVVFAPQIGFNRWFADFPSEWILKVDFGSQGRLNEAVGSADAARVL
jgi:hypothetical protein